MVFTAFPSRGAHRHQAKDHTEEIERAETPGSPEAPGEGVVRILRSPEELAQAVARAQEFERRNAEAMRSRAQRYVDVLNAPTETEPPPAP
ncbi:MAG: hypothetical protein ACLPVF_01365 [Acidimicrobiales bacterium]